MARLFEADRRGHPSSGNRPTRMAHPATARTDGPPTHERSPSAAARRLRVGPDDDARTRRVRQTPEVPVPLPQSNPRRALPATRGRSPGDGAITPGPERRTRHVVRTVARRFRPRERRRRVNLIRLSRTGAPGDRQSRSRAWTCRLHCGPREQFDGLTRIPRCSRIGLLVLPEPRAGRERPGHPRILHRSTGPNAERVTANAAPRIATSASAPITADGAFADAR